jgi:hypothetical protein
LISRNIDSTLDFFYCDTLKNIALDFSIENDSKQKKVDYQLPDYLCLIPISDPISNLHNYMARAVFTSSFGPATLTELNQLSWYVQQIWIIHATIFEKMSCKRLEAIQTSVFFFYFNSKIKKKGFFPTQTSHRIKMPALNIWIKNSFVVPNSRRHFFLEIVHGGQISVTARSVRFCI